MEITLRSDFVVGLVDRMGSDVSVLKAMLVSSDKDTEPDATTPANRGRINSLMRNHHGTPFEHAAMTFYVEAPIFVYREWHRHRIGVSYNEMSGRYSELPMQFYTPPEDRPLMQKPGSKQMDYELVSGTVELRALKLESDVRAFEVAAEEYRRQLDAGIVKEAARTVLPVATYSKMYFTANPRSIMAFLSLRTRHEPATVSVVTEYPVRVYRDDGVELEDPTLFARRDGAMFPSKPQWEIAQCALVLEELFADQFPVTHDAYVKNGRVAP